jgi:hypothetical protein
MHLHPMTSFGIVHPIEMGRLADVHGGEGMVRGQAIIIKSGSVVRRLRLILLFAFALLGLDALIRGGGAITFLLITFNLSLAIFY